MINLETERMTGNGAVNGRNLLYGLDDLCKEYLTPDMVMLELGCHHGISTQLFASYVQKVYTVDVQSCPEDLKGISNVHHYQGKFQQLLPTLEEDFFDFIYIDGMHDYDSVVRDIRLALPLLKKGSPLGGHDYYGELPRAVETTLEITPKVFSDSSWVLYPLHETIQ